MASALSQSTLFVRIELVPGTPEVKSAETSNKSLRGVGRNQQTTTPDAMIQFVRSKEG